MKVVETSSNTSESSSLYQSFREVNQFFNALRGKNRFGSFIKISEIRKGITVTQLVILEGKNDGGWSGFSHFAKELLGSSSFVSTPKNKA